MTYELTEVLNISRVFHQVESEAQIFLSISAFAMKNKAHSVKSALATLRAIEEYKKLPSELRKELENDKSASVSKIVEIERLCKETIARNKN